MNLVISFRVPLAAALLLVAGAANAVQVPGVYNTGLGVGGTALAAGDGQIDANYTVLSSDQTGVVAGANALTYYNVAYLQDGPLSRIVNATGTDAGTAGTTTTFRTTFSLTGFDFANATISGQVLADNALTVLLNGNLIGSASTFTTLTGFSSSAQFFNGAFNTLDFVLTNAGGPVAFQVAGLTVTAAELPVVAGVPEPTTWAMLVMGFGLVGASLRRRTGARAVVAA